MKRLIAMFCLALSGPAWAAEIPAQCYSKAAKAVELFVEEDYYDNGGFYAHQCEVAQNQKVVICEVSASKGEGAATDTFRVVMTKSCKRTLRVEMIGEE